MESQIRCTRMSDRNGQGNRRHSREGRDSRETNVPLPSERLGKQKKGRKGDNGNKEDKTYAKKKKRPLNFNDLLNSSFTTTKNKI